MACIHALKNCLQAYEKVYKMQKDEKSAVLSRERKMLNEDKAS